MEKSQDSHDKLNSCLSEELDIARHNNVSLEKRYQHSLSLIVNKSDKLVESARKCYDELKDKVNSLYYKVVRDDCLKPQL